MSHFVVVPRVAVPPLRVLRGSRQIGALVILVFFAEPSATSFVIILDHLLPDLDKLSWAVAAMDRPVPFQLFPVPSGAGAPYCEGVREAVPSAGPFLRPLTDGKTWGRRCVVLLLDFLVDLP